MGKCTFHFEWLSNPLYSEWLAEYKRTDTKRFVQCVKKDFSLGMMCAEVTCSRKGARKEFKHCETKHQDICVRSFHTRSCCHSVLQDTPSATLASATHQSPGPSRRTETSVMHNMSCISHHFGSNDILKAEVLWVMHTISRHSSYSSNENISEYVPRQHDCNQVYLQSD